MPHFARVETTEKSYVDTTTGEVFGTYKEEKTYGKNYEPTNVHIYTLELRELIAEIVKNDGMTKTTYALLFWLISRMRYEDGQSEIKFSTVDRKKAKKDLGGITDRTMYTSLNTLEKLNIIMKLDSATIIMNPYIFARGSWNQISKARGRWDLRTTYGNEDI
jgi:hypothetical protein